MILKQEQEENKILSFSDHEHPRADGTNYTFSMDMDSTVVMLALIVGVLGFGVLHYLSGWSATAAFSVAVIIGFIAIIAFVMLRTGLPHRALEILRDVNRDNKTADVELARIKVQAMILLMEAKQNNADWQAASDQSRVIAELRSKNNQLTDALSVATPTNFVPAEVEPSTDIVQDTFECIRLIIQRHRNGDTISRAGCTRFLNMSVADWNRATDTMQEWGLIEKSPNGTRAIVDANSMLLALEKHTTMYAVRM